MSWIARQSLALVLALLVLQPLLVLAERGAGVLLDGTMDQVLSGAQVGILFANAIFLALLTTLFAAVLAIGVVMALGLYRVRGEGLWTALLLTPLIIPPHIHTIAWTRVLGDKGWLSLWLAEQGMPMNVRLPLATDGLLAHIYPGPAWVMACSFFPLIALPMIMTLRRLDQESFAALSLSIPQRRALFIRAKVEARPAFFTGLIAVFALALVTYPVVSLLDTPVLVQKVYFVFSQVDQAAGAVLALPLVLMAVLATFALTRAEQSLMAGLRGKARPRDAASPSAIALLVTVLVVTSGVPLVSLLREAGPLAIAGGTDNYQSVFARTAEAFCDTGALLLWAMPPLLLLSVLAARWMARGRVGGLDAVATLPLALPPVVVGVALLLNVAAMDSGRAALCALLAGAVAGLVSVGSMRERFLSAFVVALAATALHWGLGVSGLARVILTEGPTLPVLGWLALYLPLCARLMRVAYQSVDRDGMDAARLSGANSLTRFRVAEWPAVRGTLAAVAILGFILCMTELSATLLLLRPGWQFLQVRIFNMVHYQSAGEVAALCVLVLVATLLPVMVWRLLAKGQRA
jgi:iron(III) transport system permease protein